MNLRLQIPPATRFLLAALLVISLTSQYLHLFGDPYQDFLSLVPQYSIFYPWTYLTATFAEPNIITLLFIAGPAILYGGRYFERACGSMEFGRFVLLVAITSNFVTALCSVLWFAITRSAEDALRPISSSIALQSAFLVSFKQLVPEHTLTLFSALPSPLRIRVKHLPFLYLLTQTLLAIFLRMRAAFLLAWTGFLISWVYLRFMKKSEDEGTGMRLRGDPSTLFSFASFFPEVTQPYISQVSDPMYSLFTGLGLLKPFTVEETSAGDDLAHARNAGELPSIGNPRGTVGEMPNSRQREEAERRRRLALEALDQRLAAASQRGKPQSKGRGVSPVPPANVSDATSATQESSDEGKNKDAAGNERDQAREGEHSQR